MKNISGEVVEKIKTRILCIQKPYPDVVPLLGTDRPQIVLKEATSNLHGI
jgi:hypothetical protein